MWHSDLAEGTFASWYRSSAIEGVVTGTQVDVFEPGHENRPFVWGDNASMLSGELL